MIHLGLIHYWAELALWMAGLFLLGCPLGALVRRVADRKRLSGGP